MEKKMPGVALLETMTVSATGDQEYDPRFDLSGTALFAGGPFDGVEFGIEFKGTLTPHP